MNVDSERIKGKLKHSKGPTARNPVTPEIQLVRSIFGGNPHELDGQLEDYSDSNEEFGEANPPKASDKKSTDDILQLVNQAFAERGRPISGTDGPKRGVGYAPMQYH